MTGTSGSYEKGTLYQLELAHLRTDPNQPRTFLDPQALDELAASIKEHGVLQPILFRVDSHAEALYIVAGERRCEAATMAGLTEVPAILVEGKHGEIALVENLCRQDLTGKSGDMTQFRRNWDRVPQFADRLMQEESYTQEQLGVIIGKARTTVTDILTLTRLPQEIRDECRGNTAVTRKTLIAIARKKQARAMITAWNKVKEKQAKEAAGGKRKERTAPTPAAHCEWVDKTNTKLATIDATAWTTEERATFNTALGELKKTILALLKTKPAPPA